MIFIDMMSPKGHVRLNRFYLQHLAAKNDKIIVGSSIGNRYSEFGPVKFEDKYGGYFGRIYVAYQVLSLIIKNGDRELCFLSYDLIFMPIIALYVRVKKWRLYVFEHNTVPNTLVRRLFQKISGRCVMHLTYAPHIAALFSRLGLENCVVDHPALALADSDFAPHGTDELEIIRKTKRNFERLIFCPSGSVGWKDVRQFVKKNTRMLFVIKGQELILEKNVISFTRINNYRGVLNESDMIYIPFPHDTRVSGPCYEAIAAGKIVMVKNNEFGYYIKSLFPTNIIFEEESIDFLNGRRLCVTMYNENIALALKRLLGRLPQRGQRHYPMEF